jgi:hypothetical protein
VEKMVRASPCNNQDQCHDASEEEEVGIVCGHPSCSIVVVVVVAQEGETLSCSYVVRFAEHEGLPRMVVIMITELPSLAMTCVRPNF